MKLRFKAALALTIALASMLLMLGGATSWIIHRGFEEIEQREGMLNLRRVDQAFAHDIDMLVQKSRDWAVWDDAYQYLQDGNSKFAESNLTIEPLNAMRLDAIIFYNFEKGVIGGFYKKEGETEGTSGCDPRLQPELLRIAAEVRSSGSAGLVAGLYKSAGKLWEISAKSVARSDGSGDRHGFCIFARIFNEESVAGLGALTETRLEISTEYEKKPPPAPLWLAGAQGDTLQGFVVLNDINKNPAMVLRAEFSREIMAQGSRSATYLMGALALAGGVWVIVTLLLLEFLVLRRVARFSTQVREIGERGAVSARVSVEGRDELGQLCESVNEMLTDLERAEREARESERKFLVMADTAPVLIRICDDQGMGSFFNKAWTEFTGRSAHEEEELGWMESVHPSDVPKLLLFEKEIRDARSLGKVEFRLRQKSGEYRWMLESRAPRFGNDNQFLGTIGSAVDITDRKNLERALVEAKEAAELATRTKSEFLAKMTHELRTPMNGVLGMLDVALESELPAEQVHNITVARKSAAQLLDIVNDILDFSKVEAGRLTLEQLPCVVAGIMRDAADVVRPLAQRKNLQLIESCEIPENVELLTDPTRLRQVLINLLSNAVKFTEKGTVTISARVLRSDDASLDVRFSVRDTGVGIPEDKVSRIFEAFAQADGTITRRFGGTGLGLAISSQITGLMGGEISVESREGEGSEFSFQLTLLKVCTAKNSREGAKRVLARWESAETPLRILVTDDNSINRIVASRILTKVGHQVIEAESGVDAVRIAAAGGVDLILMDVQMPGMDGMEAARQIREMERGGSRRVPILALTAQTMDGDREKCMESGMDGYVTKPIMAIELFAEARRVLDGVARKSAS